MSFVYILIALGILLAMITIHEFGHYIVGKKLGFAINEFAVGFGPVIAIPKLWDKSAMEIKKAFNNKCDRYFKENNTVYIPTKEEWKEYKKCFLFRLQWLNKTGERISIRALPLGGYCAFEGEDKVEELGTGRLSFNAQKPWKRLLVSVAGCTANLLTGLIFCFIFLVSVGYDTVSIVDVNNTSENYGVIQNNDLVLAINDQEIDAINGWNKLLKGMKKGDEYKFTVARNNEEVDLILKVGDYTAEKDGEIITYTGFGITIKPVNQKIGFGTALAQTFPFAWDMATTVLGALWQLITGQIAFNQIGGTISAVVIMSQLTAQSLTNILLLFPLLSINLGIFNLLPIPALDGGRSVFMILEWIFGKPVVKRETEAKIHTIGIMLLLAFVLLADFFFLFFR